MPQFTQLGYNCSVFLEALDPTTGDPVDGVTVNAVDIYADVAPGDGSQGGGYGIGNPILLGVNA